MFNSVEYVRHICKQKNIAISVLEKKCGFSNGYLNPKKMSRIPYDRALVIAAYLDISVDLIMTGEEKAPADIGKGLVDSSVQKDENIIRIAGRDGSFVERRLTDSELAAFKAMLDALPEAPDDL